MTGPWQLTIHGIPRTKKTHNEIHLTVHRFKMRAWVRMLAAAPDATLTRLVLQRVKVQPSRLYRQWVKDAILQWHGPRPELPITELVHLQAAIYRQRADGDVQGFQQAIADYLETLAVLKNDRLVEHWDGTRRLKDKDHPRIELTITPI